VEKAHTSHHKTRAAAQAENTGLDCNREPGGVMRAGSSNRPSFTGQEGRRTARPRFEAALAAFGAVASMAFIFAIVAFVQTRPNVPTVPADCEFDGTRAFADLTGLVRFGPRPPGSPALVSELL
jgi:hypothetical protein